jgi:DNA-binding CsgD family transcriptional regulator
MEELSPREAEVLDLVGRHLSNPQIADRLYISVRTVESHVASLIRKRGVADRRALVAYAAQDHFPRFAASDRAPTFPCRARRSSAAGPSASSYAR